MSFPDQSYALEEKIILAQTAKLIRVAFFISEVAP